MRFAIAAVASAGVVMAQSISTAYTTSATVTSAEALTTSTLYTTKYYTITSCPPSVPHCPAHSTVVVTETEVIGTTVCPVETTKSYSNHTGSPTHSYTPPKPTKETTLSSAAPTKPACPTYSVKTIHTSYTTVLPTVVYETVSIACPTPSKPSASAPNGTTPAVPTKTPVTAGASSLVGSVFVAAAAGVAALVFA